MIYSVYKKLNMKTLLLLNFCTDQYHSVKVSRNVDNDFPTSGGMILMINKNIKQVVSLLKNSNSEIKWLKVCKTFFGLNKDIYVCFVYLPPSNSSYAIRHNLDIMDTLCSDVMNYGKSGFLVICGNFNARTARETENVENDKFVPLSINDISFTLPARCSHDCCL